MSHVLTPHLGLGLSKPYDYLERRRNLPISKVSSRELNQHTGRAKKAATSGPVIITERGRPTHVLLTFEEYQRLAGSKGSIVERLGLPPGIEDVELEIPQLRDPVRPANHRVAVRPGDPDQ